MPIINVPKPIKDAAYYCPYCKRVFKNVMLADESDVEEKYSYQCISGDCNKYFNRDTYREKRGNGIKYHYIQYSKLTVGEMITKHIINLLLEGESQKDIHTITHFSRELIDKSIKSYFNQSKTFTLTSFKRLYLEDRADLWSNIENAIKKGCSHRITSKLYNVGNTTIGRALRGKSPTINYDVKISMQDNTIIVTSHKKERFFS
ncbi:MAG: hypothetical protein GQ531_03080 [Sulfurovum sp.]|nr:hypothetical protein [Sulfurovum sp.]